MATGKGGWGRLAYCALSRVIPCATSEVSSAECNVSYNNWAHHLVRLKVKPDVLSTTFWKQFYLHSMDMQDSVGILPDKFYFNMEALSDQAVFLAAQQAEIDVDVAGDDASPMEIALSDAIDILASDAFSVPGGKKGSKRKAREGEDAKAAEALVNGQAKQSYRGQGKV